MVNIYILTSDQKVYDKLKEGLQKTSYMDIASYQLDSIDKLIDRIDNHQDVDVALISEDIVSQISFNMIDREIVKARNIPYLIVNTSEKILMEAIHSNAQDIILLNNLDIDRAVWSILHSLERNKMINRLYEDSIEDQLTGLYNRRGFLSLAKDAIRLMDEPSYHILFIDMDKMKDINDEYGHDVGDNALKEASRILRTSFREGDIISRYGGDEFIVFVSSIKDDVIEDIKDRIESSACKFNENDNSKYNLGLTIGHAKYDSDGKESLQQVINRADKDMYLNKIDTDR
tara:strand:- start:470 stop:1333 length:864 start_codon:yes stop_codon:yes gene_type:complete